MRRGIFLDRDNTINKNEGGYLLGWDQFEFLPGVLEAFFELYQMDYDVFVVSNQSGIAEGLEYKDSAVTHGTIATLFDIMCIKIDRHIHGMTGRPYSTARSLVVRQFMFCPHASDAGCACRKPKPGMIYSLAVKWEIDLSKSWMIGDQDSDMRAGYNAGIWRMIKIEREAMPYDAESDKVMFETLGKPCFRIPIRFPSLLDAVHYIKEVDRQEAKHVAKKG